MNERKRIERQQKAIKAESDAVDTALKDLLASRSGRLFVWWLLDITNHGQQPFTTNALSTSFNCGVLNVGQQLLARLLAVDAAGYLRMLHERTETAEPVPGGYDSDGPEELDE